MSLIEEISFLGYEIQPSEKPFIKAKKFDEQNIANIVIIFDEEAKKVSGGLVTVAPIRTIDDIAHQYKIFREFDKDIKYLSAQTGYGII